jgi:hypothetical protein
MVIAGNFANEAFSRILQQAPGKKSGCHQDYLYYQQDSVCNEIIDILVAIYKSSQIDLNALSAWCDSDQMSFVIELRNQTINGILHGYQILCIVRIGILMSPHVNVVPTQIQLLQHSTGISMGWCGSWGNGWEDKLLAKQISATQRNEQAYGSRS